MLSQKEWNKLFEFDEVEWQAKTIKLIEQGRMNELDSVNLKVTLIEMVHVEKRILESKMTTLIMHLLKWRYQPELRSSSWKTTINRERREIKSHIGKSKNLLKYSKSDACFLSSFKNAIKDSRTETGIKIPFDVVFSYDQVMDNSFWP